MKEELIIEKIVLYDNYSDVNKIINNNSKKNYFLVRHNSCEKKLFFKNFNPPTKKIVGDY
jgi:hypothetical protein